MGFWYFWLLCVTSSFACGLGRCDCVWVSILDFGFMLVLLIVLVSCEVAVVCVCSFVFLGLWVFGFWSPGEFVWLLVGFVCLGLVCLSSVAARVL